MAEKIKNTKIESFVQFEQKIIEVSLRGKYLPNILVKLGEFNNNAEARKFIRNSGVLVEGQLIKDIDYLLLDQNLIEVNGTKYNVRIL